MSIVFNINAGFDHGGSGRRKHRLSRSTRWSTLATTWLGSAVLALVGCSSGSAAPTGVAAYNTVCKGTGVPQAAAYQGAGPHPIAFFLNGFSGGDGTVDSVDPDWVVPGSWNTSNPDLVQLVACIDISDNAKTRDCGGYAVIPGSAAKTRVTLQWQNYTISLRQAKTGALVTKPIVLVGETDDKCPYSVQPTATSDTYITYTALSATQIQQALNKYVS